MAARTGSVEVRKKNQLIISRSVREKKETHLLFS
jgi:hypothetical protein